MSVMATILKSLWSRNDLQRHVLPYVIQESGQLGETLSDRFVHLQVVQLETISKSSNELILQAY